MRQPNHGGMGDTHYLVCSCGFDPWKELDGANSGPDEDSARVALILHQREHDAMWAGAAEWIVQKDSDTWYVRMLEERGRL